MNDYEQTLEYLKGLSYDELLFMMYKTEDHFLSKKIGSLIHALKGEDNLEKVQEKHKELMEYLLHAFTQKIPENFT